jgi:hypothetical protein
MEHLPPQVTGRQTDFTQEHKYESLEAAHTGFRQAAGRMLSVSNWHEYSGAGSAKFTLCNNQGEELDVMAEEGFFMSVDMPVPGPDAGMGLEWLMIERLVSEGDAHSAEEYVLMTMRPIPDPRQSKEAIAHFYTDESTNTFIVRRDGLLVSAGAHGRNESANTEGVDLLDKLRNTAIALMARIGLSGGQWQKLVDGIVK